MPQKESPMKENETPKKKSGCLPAMVLAILIMFVVMMVHCVKQMDKPSVFSTVQISKTEYVVRVVNDNDFTWNRGRLILGSEVNSPEYFFSNWKPSEEKEIPLTSFVRRVGKQAFSPQHELSSYGRITIYVEDPDCKMTSYTF